MRGLIGSVLVAVLLGGFTEAVAQLPPEIMADRYLVQAERLMKEKEFKAALEAMEKIVALQKEHDLTLPAEFHFKYAQIAQSAGLLDPAIAAVNRYLVAAGRAGKFYREALELLDQAEKQQAEQLEEARRRQEEERRRQTRPILPEMVVIPAGGFRMGCVSGKDCQDDEKPVHEVRVESFELSKYEGRVEDWRVDYRVRWRFRRFRFGPQSGSPITFPVPALRTGRAVFPHLGSPVGSCVSHTGPRSHSWTTPAGLAPSPAPSTSAPGLPPGLLMP